MNIFDRFFKKPAPKQTAPVATPPPPPAKPVEMVKPAPIAAAMSLEAFSTSQVGIELIKGFEGCELKAYPDPATGGDPWTIGYGHTGADTKKGRVITRVEAETILKQDLKRFEDGVRKLVKVPITQAMFDALVSFSFNCGLGNLGSSTLLRKLNASDYAGASAEFPKWNKAAKKVMLGLTRRREAERQVFEKGISKEDEIKALINKIMMSP